ncbi:MAG: dicarboxylate/amino acid:cation symporter [Planctomycetales bacterium]|nr:dicarboxylate/amino acid:cation symporter [Planctomycetales bacterium]
MPHEEKQHSSSLFSKWSAIPLYWRILVAMAVGLVAGLLLQERASSLEIPSKVILQLLGALAPPLILVAVTHVLITSDITAKTAARLGGLLVLNTVVAITIGLVVAHIMQPGKAGKIEPPAKNEAGETAPNPFDLLAQNVPKSLLGPLGDQANVIGIIMIAVSVGLVLRKLKDRPLTTVLDFVDIAYTVLVTILHWIIHLVPLGVFAIVAQVVGTQGFGVFKALGMFIASVLIALSLQTVWYLLRIKFFSWARPLDVLRGVRDAIVMAFSTDSSTATMPVTYACLKDQVGLREESASMGALVGANFNNDGTALYEAMAALFIAQMLGQDLSLALQLKVVTTSIIASVGAAGIPEAGLITKTLVFTAVGLPKEYIAILLTVDWFLDRCRTTINVLGDVNVSCLLDGRVKPAAHEL